MVPIIITNESDNMEHICNVLSNCNVILQVAVGSSTTMIESGKYGVHVHVIPRENGRGNFIVTELFSKKMPTQPLTSAEVAYMLLNTKHTRSRPRPKPVSVPSRFRYSVLTHMSATSNF